MLAVSTHFELSGRGAKFPDGPMISPKPGPTLDIDVIAPDNAVIKSRPVADRAKATTTKQTA